MRGRDQRIFVSIPAYRDPELMETVDECIAKAGFPERLSFGICWQHGPDEPANSWFKDQRFRVMDLDYRESRGACWARAQAQQLWNGEDWYLQLDSHHGFTEEWDVLLLEQAVASGSNKPLLTTYAPDFRRHEPVRSQLPTAMAIDGFTDDGSMKFHGRAMPEWLGRKRPIRARFASAHFVFAPGSFVEDVPCDPDLYFIGEETMLTVRAFTHGYDLFHPSAVILWHKFSRFYRRAHWQDHEDHLQQDAVSREKVRHFLDDPHVGKFGCGTVKTIEDYEAYAGLNFRRRRIHDYTRLCLEPPNPVVDPDWMERLLTHHVRIVLSRDALPQHAVVDPLFWRIGIFDSYGNEISAINLFPLEIRSLVEGNRSSIIIVHDFASGIKPAKWILKIVSQSQGLQARLTGSIAESQVADPLLDNGALTARNSTVSDDLSARYPTAAALAKQVPVAGGFLLALVEDPERLQYVNNTGALLLELANGRLTLSEIVETVARIHDLPDGRLNEIREFFDDAEGKGLIKMTDCLGGDCNG